VHAPPAPPLLFSPFQQLEYHRQHAGRETQPRVLAVRSRAVPKVDSIGFVQENLFRLQQSRRPHSNLGRRHLSHRVRVLLVRSTNGAPHICFARDRIGGKSWPGSTTGTADVTKWTYQESTGLLTEKLDAALKATIYTYDELGRVKTRVWARSITTTYGYDANIGELRTTTYSDGTPGVSLTYDRATHKNTSQK
jgi:YD repeat-containing protein